MRGFSFLRYRIKKESRETIWMCREKIQRHLIPNLSHLIHVANGWGREGNNTVVFFLERWKNKRDGAHLSLYMCYIGLHIASVAQQELTDNCVASIQHLRFPTFLFDFISVYKRQENSKKEYIGECQAFLISLVNSMLCDAICARQVRLRCV